MGLIFFASKRGLNLLCPYSVGLIFFAPKRGLNLLCPKSGLHLFFAPLPALAPTSGHFLPYYSRCTLSPPVWAFYLPPFLHNPLEAPIFPPPLEPFPLPSGYFVLAPCLNAHLLMQCPAGQVSNVPLLSSVFASASAPFRLVACSFPPFVCFRLALDLSLASDTSCSWLLCT